MMFPQDFSPSTLRAVAVNKMCISALNERMERNGVTDINVGDKWINVKKEKPKNEETVLACVKRKNCFNPTKFIRFIVKAFYTDGKHNSEQSSYTLDDSDCYGVGFSYDEEADAYKIPEGWWESVDYVENFTVIDDDVTHWQPLPKLPKENNNE